jgi:mRNA interferase HigB
LKYGILFNKFASAMVVISKSILRDFGLKHSNAAEALNHWYKVVKSQDWENVSDVKSTFNTVDYVGNDRFVFNIKGNHYRLVAMIFFDIRTVFIRFVGTHAEYDKEDVTLI